jgi:hypothetical protein
VINFIYTDNPPEKDGVYLVVMADMEIDGEWGKPYYYVLPFEAGQWNIKKIIQVYAWTELPEITMSGAP